MKIKRFKNLWTMGLILFGSILTFFYVAKLFFPQFIVGIAELPSIVKIGNYIDTHKWAYYIAVPIYSYVIGYFLFCACCRTKILSWKSNIILVSFIIVALIIQRFLPLIYTPFNYVALILQPLLMLFVDKRASKETLTSTCICFCVDIMTQALSLQIRDITLIANKVNFATFTILLIDMLIWRILLYLYYNNKEKEK